ncbi:MAG: carbohydrate-binding domain-containing protein [Oscillospiraceae bacterium]|nr:carbohydrate-binding domain-containing protein [Oscillospiraceae bacterium]
MKNSKKKLLAALLASAMIAASALALAGCRATESSNKETAAVSEAAETQAAAQEKTQSPAAESFAAESAGALAAGGENAGVTETAATEADLTDATLFVFSDSGISVTEGKYAGYETEGTALTISESGVYAVSGTCADGSIKIKKGTTGVTLVLNGLELTSADTAPISCNKSTEVTIIAAEGTVNTLTDSEYNNDETYSENENAENAVIKCKDGTQVTICGAGTINVVANGKNGIKGGATTDEEGAASLTIKELTLNVTANADDGIKSDQELNILSGNITVSAADDGVKSDLVLNIGAEGTAGPNLLVKQSVEGIEGAIINIWSGNIVVNASEDGINAANSDLGNYAFECNIYGGTVYVNAETGDGIDSNGSLNIAGGTVEVYSASSGDNSPLDAESAVDISGGTVIALGAAGMGISTGSGGQACVSFGGSGMGGGFGGMQGMTPGGVAASSADFDESEAAGEITLLASGGELTAEQLKKGGMQGGMSQAGGTGINVSAGDEISILDPDGNVIYTAKAVRAASWVFFSSAELSEGETYTLSINGTAAATAEAGAAGMAGGFGGGFGGKGGFNGERPEMPEGGFNGEMPTPPEGGFGGERPEMPEGGFGGENGMPAPPDGTFPGGGTAAPAEGGAQSSGEGGAA